IFSASEWRCGNSKLLPAGKENSYTLCGTAGLLWNTSRSTKLAKPPDRAHWSETKMTGRPPVSGRPLEWSLGRVYDCAVVGAGCFGAWTALRLRQAGQSVALIDAFGSGNNRSSSGGSSRIIRMGYGADEIYTRWSMRSLPEWKDLFERVQQPQLFQR